MILGHSISILIICMPLDDQNVEACGDPMQHDSVDQSNQGGDDSPLEIAGALDAMPAEKPPGLEQTDELNPEIVLPLREILPGEELPVLPTEILESESDGNESPVVSKIQALKSMLIIN
jgi:hypothetical protein